MDFSKLCTPAYIYFIVSILYLFIKNLTNFNFNSLIINIAIIMLWSYLLNFLCGMGYTIIAWLIIIFPFFIFR